MDPTLYARAAFALIAVIGLIVLVGFAARRFGFGQSRAWGDKRLEIVETLMLDARRRVIVLRFDREEHVVLLGHQGETLLSPRTRIGIARTKDFPTPRSNPPADRAGPPADDRLPGTAPAGAIAALSAPRERPAASDQPRGRRPARPGKFSADLPTPKPRP